MNLQLGPFLLQQPIGRGGMSEVWRAHHVMLGLPVAVKVLMTSSQVLRDAFAEEVRAMARLEHPGVVAVLDHGLVDAAADAASGGHFPEGAPWMAMELCSGGTLEGFIPANWNGLRRILMDLLGALSVAHARGVLHLDLKPENVLISSSGDLRPGRKLTDFGLSFAQQADDDACVLGTPAYMAPEQFRRQWRDYGPWTDLYALGCMGWTLATGQPPFGAGRPPEVLMMAHEELPPPRLRSKLAVPPGLEVWLRRLLEKGIDRRFSSVPDALIALQGVDGDVPSPVRVPKHWQVETRPDARIVGLSMYGLRALPVVGRNLERGELWERLRGVEASAQPSVVVLHGVSGVGKSRLVSWLSERAGELGAASTLRLDAQGGIPAMLSRLFRCEGEDPESIQHRFESRFPNVDAYERDVLLAILSGTEVDAAERYAVLRRQLARLCRIPLLLWVDDAWTSPEAMELVERLVNSDEPLPVLVMITAATEALAENPDAARRLSEVAGGFRSLWLEITGLAPSDMDSLLMEHLRISPELAAHVRQRAKGNPSFAVQVVNDWVHRGILEVQPGGLVLKPDAVPTLPEDIQAVWAARLDRVLDSAKLDIYDTRTALELAALFGEVVDEEEWRAAAAVVSIPVAEDLGNRLVSARIFRPGRDNKRRTFAFVHAMLRESLERDAAQAGRTRALHLAIARVLQIQTHRPGVAERLAQHLLEVGAEVEAQRAFLLAAREEWRAGERSHALRLLDRAETLLQSVAPTDRRHGEVALLRAQLLHAEGDYEGARKAAEGAANQAREHGWKDLLSDALTELADTTRHRGSPSLALELFQEARALHASTGDREGLATCLCGLGELASQFGELGQALRLLQQALGIFEELGNRRKTADTLRELAETARRAGRLELAEGWVSQALDIYRALSVPSGLAASTNVQGAIARQQGRLFQAESLAMRSMSMFESLDSRQVVFPLCNLGLIFFQLDRPADSRASLERALPMLQQQGRQVLEGMAHALLLPSLSVLDDGVAWDHHFARAHRLLEETDTVDPDIAEALSLAGKRLRDPRRALAAWEMARAQWLILGFQGRVSEANAAVVRLG